MTPFFRHSLGRPGPGRGLGLRHSLGLGILLLAWLPAPSLAQDRTAELDAFWAEVSRTVAEGDFEGYAAAYHEDAILVSGLAGTSYPISQALAGWRQGFLDTRAGTMEASVEFRFTQRLSGETAAHETGIFHYQAVDAEGNPTVQYVHFEALLIKKDGWKMMMEYQKSVATQEEWNAAAFSPPSSGVLSDPVPGDLFSPADPDRTLALDVIEKARQRYGPSGVAADPRM